MMLATVFFSPSISTWMGCGACKSPEALEESVDFAADERRGRAEHVPGLDRPGRIVDRLERDDAGNSRSREQFCQRLVALLVVAVGGMRLAGVNQRWGVQELVVDQPIAERPVGRTICLQTRWMASRNGLLASVITARCLTPSMTPASTFTWAA